MFVTPEIGRFSTVGGIGVMVDDLTLALAALGLDIYIISPYYNFNRKGKTGYLAEEGAWRAAMRVSSACVCFVCVCVCVCVNSLAVLQA